MDFCEGDIFIGKTWNKNIPIYLGQIISTY